MSLISIIFPYYKKKKFLRDSVNSILNQTYQNFEILLIDDEVSEDSFGFLEEINKCEFVPEDRSRNSGLFIFDQLKITGITKVDLSKQICSKEKCTPYFENRSIYGKGFHLSSFGANYLSLKYGWENFLILPNYKFLEF